MPFTYKNDYTPNFGVKDGDFINSSFSASSKPAFGDTAGGRLLYGFLNNTIAPLFGQLGQSVLIKNFGVDVSGVANSWGYRPAINAPAASNDQYLSGGNFNAGVGAVQGKDNTVLYIGGGLFLLLFLLILLK